MRFKSDTLFFEVERLFLGFALGDEGGACFEFLRYRFIWLVYTVSTRFISDGALKIPPCFSPVMSLLGATVFYLFCCGLFSN